jgi:hypothetical protein
MQEKKIRVDMIQANDTYANWVSSNPIFELGRISYDSTNKKMKIGDGVTPWSELPYISDFDDIEFTKNQLMYNQIIESSPIEWFVFNEETKTIESLNYEKKEEIELASILVIPYQINNIIVENIGLENNYSINVVNIDGKFQSINIKNIQKIILPNCLKRINNFSFASWGIETINFSKCLENIGSYAFNNCNQLKEVIIPMKHKIIIQEGAFSYCVNLKTVNDIIDCIEDISAKVFMGCYINDVEIKSSVNKINKNAFCNLKRLVVINNDCIFNGDIFYNESYPCVVQGYKDSTTEIFTKQHNISFVDICNNVIDGGTY